MVSISQEQLDRLLSQTGQDLPQPASKKIQAFQKLTKYQVATPSTDTCAVCLCELDADVVVLSKCPTHGFHLNCIVHCYKEAQDFLKCPVCSKVYGIQMGSMPPGTMTVERNSARLPGFPLCGTITINYNFPDGIQGEEHPSPGTPYSGTSRTGYLPDNAEGNEVLRLLDLSFKRRLTFRVGMSITNGCDNTVVWNGIHHKTSMSGGQQNYGYPDDTYLARVKEELKAVAVV